MALKDWKKLTQYKDSVTWKHKRKNEHIVVQRDKMHYKYFYVFHLTSELDKTIDTIKTLKGEIDTPILSAKQYMRTH